MPSALTALKEAGIEDADIARICAPIGLDIAASSPAEIAVATMAQIISAFRKREHFQLKFGPVPVGEAEGCILAHGTLAGAQKIKKGTRLGAEHIEALKAHGIAEVIAARLDAGRSERGRGGGAAFESHLRRKH